MSQLMYDWSICALQYTILSIEFDANCHRILPRIFMINARENFEAMTKTAWKSSGRMNDDDAQLDKSRILLALRSVIFHPFQQLLHTSGNAKKHRVSTTPRFDKSRFLQFRWHKMVEKWSFFFFFLEIYLSQIYARESKLIFNVRIIVLSYMMHYLNLLVDDLIITESSFTDSSFNKITLKKKRKKNINILHSKIAMKRTFE